MAETMVLTGAALTAFWGIAHLFPTRSVVRGFGDIAVDDRLIITMEWIVEGVVLLFVGFLVATVTLVDSTSPISELVCYISAAFLMALALVSLVTGFKVKFLPFKLCPVIFTLSAALFIVGTAM